MSDLKQENCPFCGSDKISAGEVMTEYAGGHGATCTQSRCDDCGALGPEADLADGEVDYGDVKAIAAWNRRDKLHALLRDFQALAHDNEYALGDRLQRISSRITAVLNGGALDKFTPHLPRIVEQSFDIEAARAAASGRTQPEATAPAPEPEFIYEITEGTVRINPYGDEPIISGKRTYTVNTPAAQDLSAAILALPVIEFTPDLGRNWDHKKGQEDMRYRAAALASSANALSAEIPEGCARGWNGTIYHGIAEIYHCMEEGEALHMVLDDKGVPRDDKDGCVYSLVGRVEQYVALSAGDRVDAERYRWLRDKALSVDWTESLGTNAYRSRCRVNSTQMDSDIDRAILQSQKGDSHG